MFWLFLTTYSPPLIVIPYKHWQTVHIFVLAVGLFLSTQFVNALLPWGFNLLRLWKFWKIIWNFFVVVVHYQMRYCYWSFFLLPNSWDSKNAVFQYKSGKRFLSKDCAMNGKSCRYILIWLLPEKCMMTVWHKPLSTANLSQARSNILCQIFLTGCSLYEHIET